VLVQHLGTFIFMYHGLLFNRPGLCSLFEPFVVRFRGTLEGKSLTSLLSVNAQLTSAILKVDAGLETSTLTATALQFARYEDCRTM
jgi:hypothetical protein